MRETATSPVAALKSRLSETQAELAEAISEAGRRADALIAEPSEEAQRERALASDRLELLNLQVERLKRDVAAAEQVERLEKMAGLRGRHATQCAGPAQAAERVVRERVGQLEAALGELNGCRNVARDLTGALRALGDVEADCQINVRVDHDLRRRIEGLLKAYDQAMKRVG